MKIAKKLRKILTISIAFVLSMGCVFGLIACGTDDEAEETSPERSYSDNIVYLLSYATEEECPEGVIDDSVLHSFLNFAPEESYYLVFDFTVSSFEIEGWRQHFTASLAITTDDTVEARLMEAKTGKTAEKEEAGVKTITATYSLPENLTEARTYRIIVRLTFLETYESVTFRLAFYGDEEDAENIKPSEIVLFAKTTKGLTYEMNDNGTSCSVNGIGTATGSAIYIPTYASVPYYEGMFPVTAISDTAFAGCKSIRSINIPYSVTSIGRYAFESCTNLQSVNIPDNITTISASLFESCTSLRNIDIPDRVTTIGSGAFKSCTSLESIDLPEGVTSIGSNAFEGCTGIRSFTLPEGIDKIPDGLFKGLKNLATITLPECTTAIGDSAFEGCTNLASITMPDGVTSIGKSAFAGCTHLTSITMPKSVTTIGEAAFDSCASLTSITIPQNVSHIGAKAFNSCANLSRITFRNPEGWSAGGTSLETSDVSDPAKAANFLRNKYVSSTWTRK